MKETKGPEGGGFGKLLEAISREKGISKEALVKAIESALVSACRRKFTEIDNLRVAIDEETAEFRVFAKKTVVEEAANPEKEITPAQAKKLGHKVKKGEEVEIDVTPNDFGRLAAQTAKQVVVQRIREAEKETIFEEFSAREGHIVTGTVQRQEHQNLLINLGKAEAVLGPMDQIPGESFRPADRIRLFVVEVQKTTKRPVIVVSRSHPGFVRRLFESEIPEVADGIIEIKSVAREAGKRSKVAVYSKDPNIPAVGTCIGYMGSRIQIINKELGRERIDIVDYHDDPRVYIANALRPAKVGNIEINNEQKTATVIVPDDQLSLAIGREGQNVRLAVKLTGWKIDIMPESQAPKKIEEEPKERPAGPKAVKVAQPEKEIPGGKKISQLAEELGVSAKEIIHALGKAGIKAASPAAVMDPEMIKMIEQAFPGKGN